jgi:hypothetical protein
MPDPSCPKYDFTAEPPENAEKAILYLGVTRCATRLRGEEATK